MQRVLGEPAVRGHARGAVAEPAVAVVQAGGVLPDQAVIAAAAAVVSLDAHFVAHGEVIDRIAEGDHGTGPLVARGELPEGRGLREVAVEDFEVRAAGAAHRDLYQHLVATGPGDRLVYHPNVLGAEQHRRPHALR